MSKQIKITFWRDNYTGPGCLEYSWIPEGLRHTIQLPADTQEGYSTDEIGDELKPSHVQVYVADNNNEVSIEMWQFPEGAAGTSPLASARVEIYQRRNRIVGTVHYEDGTHASLEAKLDQQGRKCPQKIVGEMEE